MGTLIALDAGHGLNGNRSPIIPSGQYAGSCLIEREYASAVVQLVTSKFNQRGIETINVAPEDYDVPLATRVKRANDANADFYISVHANASAKTTPKDVNGFDGANGVETFVHTSCSDSSNTYKLGECIHTYLIKNTNRYNRGLKKADFHVLRETKMPAVLVEGGFMTNLEEAILLKNPSYRELCAKGIYEGICSYLNIPSAINIESTYKNVEHWADPLIQQMIDKQLINGYHSPSDNVTWAEIAVITLNLYDKLGGNKVD